MLLFLQKKKNPGFTLIEMIVVLVVLGLALTLILGHGRQHSPRLSLDTACTQLVGALRGTRGSAIGQDRPARLRIEPDGTLSGGPAPSKLRDVVLLGCETQGAPPRAALVVAFLPDGSARLDGAARDGAVCLGAAGLRARVAIDWFTGRVHRS